VYGEQGSQAVGNEIRFQAFDNKGSVLFSVWAGCFVDPERRVVEEEEEEDSFRGRNI